MPKVSVVIPVYNTSKYLAQCLQSLVNQTLDDIEIICINDGSTDSSLEILKDFASRDPRFVIIDKKNEGPGVARNIGIGQAKGKYLICVDSDDWLTEEGLEKAYKKIKADNADILFFDANRYFEKTGIKTILNYTSPYSRFKNKPFTRQQAGETFFQTTALLFKMYRRDFLKNNHIKYSKHKFMEDAQFYFASMLKADKITCLDYPLYNYRVSETSSTYDWKKYLTCIPEVYSTCFDLIKEYESEPEILKSFLQNRTKTLLYFYKLTPFFQKELYYKMMKEVIEKYFLKYGLNSELKKIYSLNNLQYQIVSRIEQTKLIFETY